MLTFPKCIVLLVLAVSISALTTPRFAHRARAPAVRALAAAAAEPVPVPVVVNNTVRAEPVKMLRRRSNAGRCRPQASSSAVAGTPAGGALKGDPTPSTSPKALPSSTPIASKTTSTKHIETSTTTTQSIPTPHSGGGNEPSYMIGEQTGEGTYFTTGLGACGITNNNGQNIVAVSHLLFDTYPGYNGLNPNDNPVCGKKITATYQGKSTTVTVVDRCVGCALTDLDMTPTAFTQIADQALGRIYGMTWVWDN